MRWLRTLTLLPLAGCLSILPAPDNLGGGVGYVEEQCNPDECPGGFACDSIYTSECATDCYDNEECRSGFFCCDFDAWYGDTGGNGRCRESQADTCVRGRR